MSPVSEVVTDRRSIAKVFSLRKMRGRPGGEYMITVHISPERRQVAHDASSLAMSCNNKQHTPLWCNQARLEIWRAPGEAYADGLGGSL